MAKKKVEAEIEDMDEHVTRGRTLPGMEYKVVKPLVNYGRKHEATKDEHRILTDRLEQEGDEGLRLYDKYKEHFQERDAKNGGKEAVYEAAGVRIIVKLPGEPKVFTKRVAPVDEVSAE